MRYLMAIETENGIEIGYHDDGLDPTLTPEVVFKNWEALEQWHRFMTLLLKYRDAPHIPQIWTKAFEEGG